MFREAKDAQQIEQPEPVSATSLMPDGISLDLPDRPSIAVLPFANMSGDPEQEYFSDGITEDIITDLSRLPRLFVIARNSSFTYKGRHVDVRQVGEELGVRYVLEGSVRKVGERVRITAQLVEAASGEHLWAQRYDRELQEIFTLHDEITHDIAVELEVKLVEGEQARVWRGLTDNPKAYDLALQGREFVNKMNLVDNARGRQLLEKALEFDDKFAYAMVLLGFTYHVDGLYERSESPKVCFDRAIELGTKALSLDESLSEAYALLSITYRYIGEHDRAVEYGERAVALQPNDADSNAFLCHVLVCVGRGEEALERIGIALRLNPFPPHTYLRGLGAAYRLVGRFDDAIAAYCKCLEQLPDYLPAQIGLTLTYMEAGREEEGREQARHVPRISPGFSSSRNIFLSSFKDRVIRERYVALLRKAGLPE